MEIVFNENFTHIQSDARTLGAVVIVRAQRVSRDEQNALYSTGEYSTVQYSTVGEQQVEETESEYTRLEVVKLYKLLIVKDAEVGILSRENMTCNQTYTTRWCI